jgi:hypothetical protein
MKFFFPFLAGNIILFPSSRGASVVKMVFTLEKHFVLFSSEDKLCQVWNGSFLTVTGSISEDEIRFTRDISSLKPKDMSSRKRVPVVVVTLMKLGITEVRDRLLPFDSWGGLTLVVVIFVRNLVRTCESLYVLHEHYMGRLMSLILKVFTSIWIILYISAYRHETRWSTSYSDFLIPCRWCAYI